LVFAATHMAVGALVEWRVREKAPTALIAAASAVAIDMTIFWHARDAEYEWPRGSFSLFHVIPYPHDVQSWLLVAVLIVSAVAVGVLLRRYWWGMLWGLSPDIMDFAVLRPLTGEHPIHDLFEKVSTPWGFAVEMLLVFVVVLVLYLNGKKRAAAPDRVP
jgi:hypothetical protein